MIKASLTSLVALCALCVFCPADGLGQESNARHYLLITSNDLANAFQPLVDRRISQDFSGELITVDAIDSTYNGVDIQEKIRNCVMEHYDPCTPLFLALGGDESVIPVRYCFPREGTGRIPTDLYYADIDGGSWDLDGDGIYGEVDDVSVEMLTPEVYIGRIPVREPDEVSAYINKVVTYELASPDGFSHSMLTFGEMAIYSGNDRPEDFRHHDPVSKEEILQTQWYICDVQPYWQATPFHLFSQGITPWDTSRCGDYALTPYHVVEKISQGYHFVKFHAHGGFAEWMLDPSNRGGFRTIHAAALTNSIPFILWAGGCTSAGYDCSTLDPTLSEVFIRNPHGGAVVVFGHNRDVGANRTQPALWRQIFQKKVRCLGRAFANAQAVNAPIIMNKPHDSYGFITGIPNQFKITFLGDPAINLLGAETGRQIQLFSPKGCEVIDSLETDITIRWNAQGMDFTDDDLVKLEYSADSGISWSPIPGAEALPYNGMAFVWEAGSSIACGKHYRIRVTSLSDPSLFDQSGGDFTIADLGILTVKSIPFNGVMMEGTHGLGLTTDYTLSAIIGETVTVTAPPTAGGIEFIYWSDVMGNVLKSERTYEFTFIGDMTVLAQYGQIANYYVNDETGEAGFAPGDDLNDGLSPQTPKRRIQSVLDDYPQSGCGAIIHVSEGTYRENIVLDANNTGLTLSGAGAEFAIVDGQASGSCLTLDHCELCFISGLAFSNGLASNGGGIWSLVSSPYITDCVIAENVAQANGGGLYFQDSHPVIVDCRISTNSAKGGGGVYSIRGHAVLRGCELSDNIATSNGGGMMNRDTHPLVKDCIFARNSAPRDGGAMYNYIGSSPSIEDCLFTSNSARQGGAMYNKDCSPTLRNCILRENKSTARGGGIRNFHYGNPTLLNCSLTRNSADWEGGGMFNGEFCSPLITNCVFDNNSGSKGGGICNNNYSSPTLINCTFAFNSARIKGSGVHNMEDSVPTFTNCILWDDTRVGQEGALEISGAGLAQISYSCVRGGWWPGEGLIDLDPMFADPSNGDYHLKSQAGRWHPTSESWIQDDVTNPCIDAGDPNSDWTGEMWPHGGRINMGAYGGTSEASMSLSTVGNPTEIAK